MKTAKVEEYCLEPMREGHLDRVVDIERLCFSHPWPRESFLADLGSGDACCMIARRESSVAGYTISWFVLDELHVLNLAVHPRYRRKGVGQTLLRYLLTGARGRGCRRATLELRASNTAARRLYEKHGFRPVAIRRNYYRQPEEDAVLMLLDLNSPATFNSKGREVPDGVVSKGQERS
jgi:ribosomal-protein-alanine N-acetyltransferase